MSCNSCSNVTLPGVAGPAGPAGAPGANGVGITSIVWTSNSNGDPAGTEGTTDTYTINYTNGTTATFIVTNGADGADGTNGVSLINTITAPVAVSATSYASANAIGGTPWSVPLNTLRDTGDTLRLELIVFPTKTDAEYVNLNVEVDGNVVQLYTSAPFDLKFSQNYYAEVMVDLIKTSDTTLRAEFKYTLREQFFSDYANNFITGSNIAGGLSYDYARSNQVITVSNMISNSIDVDVQMKVSNASYPAKLLVGKLYYFKKL